MCSSNACHPRWGKYHRRRHARKWWKQQMAQAWGYPPVNVEEHDDRYEILLYAAGYAKSDFNIAIKDQMLVIRVEKKDGEPAEETQWGHNRFRPGSFEKYFRLNEKIDKAEIGAKYEEGVLRIVLPKLAGSETWRKDIEID